MSTRALANQRHELHKDHASSRPLSEDYEHVGLAGELALSQLTGLSPDLTLRPGGDGGTDAHILIAYTVNVHAARKPYNLLHEQGSATADILVLAAYSDKTGEATLVGWEWGAKVLAAPVKDFGYGILNHYIPAKNLRPISELKDRVFNLAEMLGGAND
ncbi:MAG: hypothetical protein ACO3P1_14115 [Pseudomonadales bacterium]